MKQICLIVNGARHEFVIGPERVLLDLLRDDLGLTGAKQSCDRKGQCGACMVIVNGRTALSCLTKVHSLDNAQVITVEGLGTPENPHLIQQAFVLAGAIQCGYGGFPSTSLSAGKGLRYSSFYCRYPAERCAGTGGAAQRGSPCPHCFH